MPWRGLLGLIGIALVLRLPGLSESIWYDELWSTRIKVGSLYDYLRVAGGDIHPPFYTGFSYLWIKLFGDSELSIRMVPLLSGLACVPLTFAVVRRYVTASAAWIAATLMAIAPVHVWYSQEARHYTPQIALLLASFVCFFQLRRHRPEEPTRGWFLAYLACMGAAVLSHYYTLAFTAFISLVCLTRFDRTMRRVFVANLAFLSCMVALVLLKKSMARMNTRTGYLRELDAHEIFHTLFDWSFMGNAIEPINMYRRHFADELSDPLLLILQLIPLGLTAIGAFVLVRDARREKEWGRVELLAAFLVLPLFMVGLALAGFGRTFIERSLLPCTPFLFGVIGYGVISLPGRVTRLASTGVLFALVGAGLAFSWIREGEWTVYKPNPDWRSAGRYLVQELETGPRAIVLAASPATVLTYYDDRFVEVRGEVQSKEQVKPEPTGWMQTVLQWSQSFDSGEVLAASETPERFEIHYRWRTGKSELDAVYLLRSEHWQSGFQKLRERFTAESGMQFDGSTMFDGMEIQRFVTP